MIFLHRSRSGITGGETVIFTLRGLVRGTWLEAGRGVS
jgi:hypothetical protein